MSAGWGRALTCLLQRELLLSFRRPDQLLQPVVFFLIVTTCFPLALSPQLTILRQLAPGVLWVGALLASVLALESMFRSDAEDGSLEQLMLLGLPLTLVVIAKAVAHWLLAGLPLVLVSPLIALAMNLEPRCFPLIMASLALGTGILSWLGAIGAALTVSLKRGGVLLSLIVLPLAMPVIIFGASATDRAAAADSAAAPMWLLASLCLLATSLAPFAATAALRISTE